MTDSTSNVPPEVQQNPLYRNPDMNCFFDALPGDMALFRVDDRGGWGDATFAWVLREIAADPAFGSLDYKFERVGDGYRISVGVYSDRSGYMPSPQIFKMAKRSLPLLGSDELSHV